ncbi:MAG: hypothetical protein AAF989_01150 [Planctomycetota bacterium]
MDLCPSGMVEANSIRRFIKAASSLSIDQDNFVACVFAPALFIAAIGALAVSWAARRRRAGASDSTCHMDCGWMMVIGWCGSLLLSLYLRRWHDSPSGWWETVTMDEAWTRVVWPMGLFGLVLALRTRLDRRGTQPGSDSGIADDQGGGIESVSWMRAGIVAVWCAYSVMPSGENWTDLYELHRTWVPLMATAVIANAWWLDRMARSGASSWIGLVVLAGLGTPLLLSSVNYAAPAEWAVAAISATMVGFLIQLGWAWWLTRQTKDESEKSESVAQSVSLWMFAFPGSVMIAASVTTTRFRTWEEYPWWVYGIGLFLPTIVSLADFPIRRLSWKVRLPVAATLAILLIGMCFWELDPLGADAY